MNSKIKNAALTTGLLGIMALTATGCSANDMAYDADKSAPSNVTTSINRAYGNDYDYGYNNDYDGYDNDWNLRSSRYYNGINYTGTDYNRNGINTNYTGTDYNRTAANRNYTGTDYNTTGNNYDATNYNATNYNNTSAYNTLRRTGDTRYNTGLNSTTNRTSYTSPYNNIVVDNTNSNLATRMNSVTGTSGRTGSTTAMTGTTGTTTGNTTM